MGNIPDEALSYYITSLLTIPTRMYNKKYFLDRQALTMRDAPAQSEGFSAKTKRRNYVLKMLLHRGKRHAQALKVPKPHSNTVHLLEMMTIHIYYHDVD